MKTKHYKYFGRAYKNFVRTACVSEGANNTLVWVDERAVRDPGNTTVAEQSFVSGLHTRTFRLFRLPNGDIGERYFDTLPGVADTSSTKADRIFDNEIDARAYFDATNVKYSNSTKGWVKA